MARSFSLLLAAVTALLYLWTLSAPAAASSGIKELNFFLQESPSTSYFVVPALEGHEGNFGALVVIDQPVTVAPANDSQEIGEGKGLAAFANDGSTGAAEILWTIVLKDSREGGFGHGSLSFRGSNDLSLEQRELAIVGGTGDYRFASGFAFLVTYFRDPVTRYSTTNITVFVEQSSSYQTYLRVRGAGRYQGLSAES